MYLTIWLMLSVSGTKTFEEKSAFGAFITLSQ